MVTRIGLDRGDAVLYRIPGRVGSYEKTGGIVVIQRDWRIVLSGEFGKPGPVHHTDFNGCNTDGIAIRFGIGDCRVTNNSAATCAINHIHWLSEFGLQQ